MSPSVGACCVAAAAVLVAVLASARVPLRHCVTRVVRSSPRRRASAPRRRAAVLGLLAGLALLVVVPWPLAPLLSLACSGVCLAVALAAPSDLPPPEELEPLLVDVLAVVLAAGAAPSQALRGAAELAGPALGAELRQVAHRLDLGVEPARAWAELRERPDLAGMARAIVRTTATGSSPVPLLQAEAQQRRELRSTRVRARAAKVAALATLPLGLCFLPAFLLLGVVPIVATLVLPLLGLFR